jgi:hypothetical protein
MEAVEDAVEHVRSPMKIIDVSHSCIDGWHEFTSRQVPGLYLIAEHDGLESAYNDLPLAIKHIVEADTGVEVVIEAHQTYDEYAETLPDHYFPSVYYSIERVAA